MICSGCGKDVSFVGAVCPYCKRNKSNDQSDTVLMWSFGIVGGIIGYNIFDAGGGLAGLLFGMLFAFFFSNLANEGKISNKSKTNKRATIKTDESLNLTKKIQSQSIILKQKRLF